MCDLSPVVWDALYLSGEAALEAYVLQDMVLLRRATIEHRMEMCILLMAPVQAGKSIWTRLAMAHWDLER